MRQQLRQAQSVETALAIKADIISKLLNRLGLLELSTGTEQIWSLHSPTTLCDIMSGSMIRRTSCTAAAGLDSRDRGSGEWMT